jgi:hypothetical protein
MDQAGMTASPQRRVIFLVVAALMLLLWGLSLIPPVFYASIICLPQSHSLMSFTANIHAISKAAIHCAAKLNARIDAAIAA